MANIFSKIAGSIGSYLKELVTTPVIVASAATEKVAPTALPIAAGVAAGVATGSPFVGVGTAAGTATFFGALEKKPTETIKAVTQAPTSAANVFSNIGGAIADPSKESVTKIFKENPLASTLIAGGAIAVAGKGVSNIVGSYLTTSAVKENI